MNSYARRFSIAALVPALLLTCSLTAVLTAHAAEAPHVTTTKWDLMDVGPFFSSGLREQAPPPPAPEPEAKANEKDAKGDKKAAKKPAKKEDPVGRSLSLKTISIKLGGTNGAAVAFDTELMRMAAGWTGEFLKLPVKRDGLEGVPEIKGHTVFLTPMTPGWAFKGSFADPRPRYTPTEPPYGPLPKDWVKWRGLYLYGEQTILSYTVGKSGVLEMPALETTSGLSLITRTLQMEASKVPLKLMLGGDSVRNIYIREDGIADLTTSNATEHVYIAVVGAPLNSRLDGSRSLVDLQLPASRDGYHFKIVYGTGTVEDASKFAAALKNLAPATDLAALTHGGPARWTIPVETKGVLGKNDNPYTVDTITLPEENPWKSWIRCSGFDFFKDGRVALCSVSGDVWVASGIDATLDKITWKRYATGLFQPLGLKIVNDIVYVVGRDQITRLHDLNGDGEADFYENFNNDISITSHYHEFCLNLDTDSKGNFYFNKGSNLGEAKIPHQGCLIRISKDGGKLEVYATGYRAPNGLSIGPKDQITSSDNEGNWTPVCRINLMEKGGFYGYVGTAHRTPAPTNYDAPIMWIPYQVDNSSGGQTWVPDDRWGPLKGHMIHTSYGKSSLFSVMYEVIHGIPQGGLVRFPLNFDSGIMRARFSKIDGQLYTCGLRVWQSNGAREGAFHRVRYTGKPVELPVELHVKKNGIAITFNAPLDPKTAVDMDNYAVDQWNYRWTSSYGSKMYSVKNPAKEIGEKGQSAYKGDVVEVKSVKLSKDLKTVFLEIPEIAPVMSMRIRYNIDTADGMSLKQEIFNTINIVPKK